ncbi:unnamed protein product [Aureobasidium vineae]|uniref:DUF7707 domain-containing protein n=1 Tax=Aureobasidium vineae TaxID=2773715 RepID=A0A9N8P575_9PEZI|nr:unnamed protein product [Aureobasidium vineae]
MRGFGLLLLPVVAKLASAQSQYTINVTAVPEATRDIWCTNQQNACPLICLQTSANSSDTIENECDPDTLDYSCICENNIAPNASEYSQTIPYYVCTEWGTECIAGCGGNTAQHPCGAQNPTRVNVTSSSSSATASKTASNQGAATNSAGQTIFSGLGGSGAAQTSTSSSQTGAAAALQLGQAYGLFAVTAGIFGGFALLL